MSIVNPRNLTELKEYIKIRLGAPVLEINVSDEQMDVAINDGFAYYFGKQHYNGTERNYLGVKIEQPFFDWWETKDLTTVTQDDEQLIYGDGMVDTITLTAAGSGYPRQSGNGDTQLNVGTTTTSGSGEGLTVDLGSARTTQQGLVTATVNQTGIGYVVGDTFTIDGYNTDTGTPATFEVATIKTSSPIYGKQTFETQNNYLILPENVIGVTRIMKTRFGGTGGMIAMSGSIPGIGMYAPFLTAGGGNCGGMQYDLTSYYTMQQYLATLDWMFYPPISFKHNNLTNRLWIDSDNFNGLGVGDYLVIECDMFPNPEEFNQFYGHFWLREYWVNLVKYQWGQNLTKYQNVQLPGGITLNGEAIKQEAMQELQGMRDRFAMDCADPPLDACG